MGELVAKEKATVAICEDLSGGSVASAFQSAADSAFLQSSIVNSNEAVEKIALAGGETPPFADGAERAAALARAVRKTTGAIYGIAVHGAEEGDQRTENLGRGETYIVVSGPNGERTRHVRSAGRGEPDRQRAAMGALSVFRQELLGLSE